MRALILRTFTHNRIWEADKKECTFGEKSYVNQVELITSLEPRIGSYLTDDFEFAIGIYMAEYFNNNRVYTQTPEEETISILKLRGSPEKTFVRNTFGNQLHLTYDFVSKIAGNRTQMNHLDTKLINMKILKENPNNKRFRYFPLCFSLDSDLVKSELLSIYGTTGLDT